MAELELLVDGHVDVVEARSLRPELREAILRGARPL